MAKKVAPKALEYLAKQRAMTLATTGIDGPWAATLTYVNDGGLIHFWTRTSSSTAQRIQDNNRVAFAIDEYTDDWRNTRGIQGRGTCEPVTGDDIARVAAAFGEKYPELRPGSTSAVVFYEIDPDILEFIDNTRGVDESGDFGAEYRRESAFDLEAIDEGDDG